jgi:short-subunit dehydrogenase
MINLKQKYGSTALVAGASEGIGAAYATSLAAEGMNLVLVARRMKPLQQLSEKLNETYKVEIQCISCDLGNATAIQQIKKALNGKEVNLLVYNAALPYIGPFIKSSPEYHAQMAQVNMLTPINMLHFFGEKMLTKGKGAIILMSSLAGFQGSGFLAMYSSTKAFNRIMAESLWYEWKDKGVDVLACCASSTATPNFIKSNPEDTGFFAPKVQRPEEVVNECLKMLGRKPSFIPGLGNKLAAFFMQKLLSRKMAVKIMGDNTKKMYRQ